LRLADREAYTEATNNTADSRGRNRSPKNMATGTSRTVSAPVFHGNDPEQITEYRTLSVLAIISLIMGLAAPLAVAAPFLLAIPLFGIAVSLVALRRIAVSEGVLAGRWAATIGLVLCVASAVLPISHDLIQRTIRINQAEKFGLDWVAMVTSGNTKEAFRHTVDGTRPMPPAEPNAPPKPNPYETFVGQPVIKMLQAAGVGADIRIRDTVDYQAANWRSITVRQLYSVTPGSTASAGANSRPTEFVLSVQRATLPRESMSRWLVTSYAFSNATTDSSVK
jgi:hypothetical protein